MRPLLPLLLLAGCGPGVPVEVTYAEGPIHKYVVNKLLVPMQRSDYAIDLNGDRRADNQLGNIIGALAAQNIDTQMGFDESVSLGVMPLLLSVQATSLKDDEHAGVLVQLARSRPRPNFDGKDTFTVDDLFPAGQLLGHITASKLQSNSPVYTTPATITIPFQLFPRALPITLPLEGAHIQLKTGTDSASMKAGLLEGQIHGSIPKATVDDLLIPMIAEELTIIVATQANPYLQAIFDTGGCPGAAPNDRHIDYCEVSTNAIIINVLGPDVEIHDAAGHYAPSPNNLHKDSVSFGLGFTAVAADF